MADILIRDVPDEVVAALDARAKSQGLSRVEYLRRLLVRDRDAAPDVTVVLDDLRSIARLAVDLDDPDVMASAWT